jgi:hypothetical protein
MEGVEVTVEDGMATIRFTDRSKRAAAVGKLIASGGPEIIEYLSIDYPYPAYRVPEGNAREAGLIGKDKPAKAVAADVPNDGWPRAKLDEYALDKRGLDTTHLRSKAEVLDALAESG